MGLPTVGELPTLQRQRHAINSLRDVLIREQSLSIRL